MKESGLTLLEVLITVTIIMVLASAAMPISQIAMKRTREIEMHQDLRTMRAAIDAFRAEWIRDGDVLQGPLCIKNKLTCKEVSGISGYPKSLDVLLKVTLTGAESTVKGESIKRYLRRIPLDPFSGKADWTLRCYTDPPNVSSWCGEDIFDVSSSSPDVALDGSKYRDW